MFRSNMSRNLPVAVLGLLATGLAAGCASSQMNRIDRNRDLYESWPIEIRQAVLDGNVEPGMTPDMVELSWGRPTEIVNQGGAGDEVWVYKIGGDEGSVYYPGAGGGIYPAGGYPSNRPGIVLGTGSGMGGRIGVGGTVGGGYPGGVYPGGGYPGAGMGTPIVTPPTPPDIREVVFRKGVVHRADKK